MPKKYLIKSCLICDLARKEQGGKDILVGVYAGVMMAREVPFTIPSFAVWLELKPVKIISGAFTLEILTPEGEKLTGAEGEIAFNDGNEFFGVPFQFSLTTFPSEGVYKIRLGFEGEPEEIGEFQVRRKN